MITDELINIMEMYNEIKGWSKEIDRLIDFLREVDGDILNASRDRQEKFVTKYLELYGR